MTWLARPLARLQPLHNSPSVTAIASSFSVKASGAGSMAMRYHPAANSLASVLMMVSVSFASQRISIRYRADRRPCSDVTSAPARRVEAQTANCAAKAAQRGFPIGMGRMMGLETAATLMGGKVQLAEELAIQPRTLRAKLSADRGVSNVDLMLAAGALEARAARMIEHANKLRAEAAGVSAADAAKTRVEVQ